MFKHILHATDFSPAALRATNATRELAQRTGAKVTLLTVFEPPSPNAAVDGRKADDWLEVLRSDSFAGVDDVDIVALPGPRPETVICQEAAARNADLIVVGRHGRHAVSERLLGTTSERVARHAPCSVWVTHAAQQEHVVAFDHLLACSDLSEESRGAVALTGALARSFSAHVTLAHVYDIFPPVELIARNYEEDEIAQYGNLLQTRLERLRAELLPEVAGETRALRDKSTVTALCDYAGDHQVKLMVVGTHGLTGIRRVLIGSVAERVIRHAPCAVLVFRPSRVLKNSRRQHRRVHLS